MKKVKILPILLIVALTALIAVGVFGFANSKSAYAYDNRNTYISAYRINYDIKSNRSISVTEDITVNFDDGTGVYRYIPVNAGEIVKDLEVCELVNGAQTQVDYSVTYDNGAMVLDIGDRTIKNTRHTYRINYEYCLTKAQEGENMLALTPVGSDWPCKIENVSITAILPEGYIGGSAACFVNYYGSITEIDYNEAVSNGRTVITASTNYLAKGSEMRLDMKFNEGALTTYSSYKHLLYLIPAALLLAALILLKLFVFNKNKLMPVVNYEAPNKMDPLIMGKLIDNTVDSEDVTALIYYWASKGYVKINLDDKNDPAIIRINQQLPANSPDYEHYMYAQLFRKGDVVKPSQLKNSFYKVIDATSSMVNKRAKNLYDKKSIIACWVFAVLSVLILGLVPFITVISELSGKFLFVSGFIMIVPVVIINLLSQALVHIRLKLSKVKLALFIGGIAILSCAFCGLYYILVPATVLSAAEKILLYALCVPVFTGSVLLITRTKEYNDKLNDITGFKSFIQLAEKSQLEMMLESDPQFYYHILPYAQVLGVTDKWEEKFADLTVEPPQWLTGNIVTTYFEFRILNSMLRNSMRSMSKDMISRPSSSGLSGGGHGSFGGFSGGGHGGGGGGFR